MKTVTAVSDIHGSWDDLPPPPEANFLVFAGDLTSNGKLQNAMAFLEWAKQFGPYFDTVIMTPGNHDSVFETQDQLLRAEAGARDIELLIDQTKVYDGVKVHATPWSLIYGSWSFMQSEMVLARKYAGIEDDVELLISHGPPLGILDLTRRGGVRAGSEALAKTIERLTKLKAFVCGHIHESYGRQIIRDGCTAYNVACLDDRYCMRSQDQWTNFAM